MTSSVHELGLPESITDKVVMHPVEDLALAISRDKLPDLPCYSLIPLDTSDTPFFAVYRRVPFVGAWNGDHRFIDHANLVAHVFTKDPNADEKGALISEAIRQSFWEAGREQKEYPGLGHLISVRMPTEPTRQTDWATSSGPVQYADLPLGFFRYQTNYTWKIRRPS